MFSPLQLGNCRWSRPCIVVGITTFPGAQDTNFELLLLWGFVLFKWPTYEYFASPHLLSKHYTVQESQGEPREPVLYT